MNKNSSGFNFVFCCVLVTFLPTIMVVNVTGVDGELTQNQAVTRARDILRNNAGACGITLTQSVAAVRAKPGWRVTAKIKMSGTLEMAVWLITEADGAAPQNQLTSEIEKGCP